MSKLCTGYPPPSASQEFNKNEELFTTCKQCRERLLLSPIIRKQGWNGADRGLRCYLQAVLKMFSLQLDIFLFKYPTAHHASMHSSSLIFKAKRNCFFLHHDRTFRNCSLPYSNQVYNIRRLAVFVRPKKRGAKRCR